MNLNLSCFLISQNISADLKEPKVKYKLHYGRCMGPLFRNATRHNAMFRIFGGIRMHSSDSITQEVDRRCTIFMRPEEDKAFEKLKDSNTRDATMTFFNPRKQIVVRTEASFHEGL